MTVLSEKALELLQANADKTEFSNSFLIANGFSVDTAKLAIKELEENGCIYIDRTYANGNVVFTLA